MAAIVKLPSGSWRIHDLKLNKLIEYGKTRAKEGAGPATLTIDFSFIGTATESICPSWRLFGLW
jgi:hypothetical protein